MGSATLTSVRTCTPTLSCPVAPPCTPVSPTECRRRSPLLPHPPSRSRSLLLPRGSTPYGSVAPSCPPCPPSSRFGSPSRSTTSAAHPLSTASASKCAHCFHPGVKTNYKLVKHKKQSEKNISYSLQKKEKKKKKKS